MFWLLDCSFSGNKLTCGVDIRQPCASDGNITGRIVADVICVIFNSSVLYLYCEL